MNQRTEIESPGVFPFDIELQPEVFLSEFEGIVHPGEYCTSHLKQLQGQNPELYNFFLSRSLGVMQGSTEDPSDNDVELAAQYAMSAMFMLEKLENIQGVEGLKFDQQDISTYERFLTEGIYDSQWHDPETAQQLLEAQVHPLTSSYEQVIYLLEHLSPKIFEGVRSISVHTDEPHKPARFMGFADSWMLMYTKWHIVHLQGGSGPLNIIL